MFYCNEKNFIANVLEAKETVVLIPWAAECILCRNSEKDLLALAEAYPKIKFIKFDTTQLSESILIEKYQIHGIPAFLIFKDGRLVDRMDGYDNLMKLEKFIRNNL